ncbi:MAG: alpha/beta hydrolase [Chloroflexi bacterium]|nr:alpha/beta hydrolase [Chloroflexota bacterium]
MGTAQHVDVPGASLWTVRQGDGPALVLCHGGPGLWDYLGPVADAVDDLATVYRYDQRACGRSTGDSRYDMAIAIADLEALREHWGVERWVVAGHSFGATLALAYCLTHPSRVSGLIYLSGTGVDSAWHAEYRANRAARLGPEGQRRLSELQARLSLARGEEFAAVSRAYSELYLSTDLADPTHMRRVMPSLFIEGMHPKQEVNRLLGEDANRFVESAGLPEQLAACPTRALIVHGEADPRPVWAARKLAGLLPCAALVTIPDAGHYPWLERPDVFRDTLRSFLAAP